jgi:hypothetical protein
MELKRATANDLAAAWNRLKKAADEYNAAAEEAKALGLWWEVSTGFSVVSCTARLSPRKATYSALLDDSAGEAK